jgi:L-fuconolactonase
MSAQSSNHQWLSQVVEEALEPDLPICDPHHHLWEFRYERVADRYLLDEILADLDAGHNIVSTVFIECGAAYKQSAVSAGHEVVGETEFVNGIAAMSNSGEYGSCQIAAGIIGTAELELGDAVGDILDAHVAAGGGRFRGIRTQATWDASEAVKNGRNVLAPGRFLDRDFQRGFAQLGARNLSFEAWCYHPQLADVIALANAFPNVQIILDHFGGPLGLGPYAGKADEVFAAWKPVMTELARCENVVAKLGGINMELNGFGWHEQASPPDSETLMQATRRYYEHTLDVFGAQRCMFESNFPVDMVSCSYTVLWNSFKRLTANYSASEKASLYHDTAARVYRL